MGSSAGTVSLSKISPSRTTVGVPQGALRLLGQNFTPNSTVLFDGAVGTSFFEGSGEIDLQIDVSVAQKAANHTVQVQDATGKSAILTYSVYQPGRGPQAFLAQPDFYTLQVDPVDAALADFNGNGLDDAVVIAGHTMLILDGRKDGSFSSPRPVALTPAGGWEPVVAGDLNGDGFPDLVAMSMNQTTTGSQFWSLLNDGQGNFRQSSEASFPALSFAHPILADFRGTGHLDLLVGLASSMSPLLLFPGQGDGSFGSPLTVASAGPNCIQVASADFNGDGKPDVVYQIGGSMHDHAVVLLNQGNGTFTDTQQAALAGVDGPFALADFNNEHKPDLLLYQGPPPNSTGVLMLGQGDGTFLQVNSFPMTGIGFSTLLVPGDLDGDGNMDVVTGTGVNGPDQTGILWGDGAGNLSLQLVTAESSGHPVIGDVNGDGVSDLVQPARFYSVALTLGRKDRKLASPIPILPEGPGLLSAADVLGDGYQDLMVSGNLTINGNLSGQIYHYQPDGSFKSIGLTPPDGVLIADLDGDGKADLIGFSGNDIEIWKGDGSGDFTSLSPVFTSAINERTGVIVRDMDRDGLTDIVLGGLILYGKGGMNFDALTLPAGINDPFAVGDFDGDGNLDVATQVGVMFGGGSRQFSTPTGEVPGFASGGYNANWVAADVNSDGKDDLIYANGSNLDVALSAGRSGIFLDQQLNAVDIIGSLGVADFNGDGRLDIVVMTSFAADAILFTNDGQGGYLFSSSSTGAQSVGGLVADLNRDGKPDLAIQNFPLAFRPNNVVVVLHQ
jgi:hypothetical protein